jgi:hypothetical protein
VAHLRVGAEKFVHGGRSLTVTAIGLANVAAIQAPTVPADKLPSHPENHLGRLALRLQCA